MWRYFAMKLRATSLILLAAPTWAEPYMGEDDLINATNAPMRQCPRRTLHLPGLSSSAHD